MRTLQGIAVYLCLFLASQPTSCVVNNGNSHKEFETNSGSHQSNTQPEAPSQIPDSEASASNGDLTRREAPTLGNIYGSPPLGDTYGPPHQLQDSYIPTGHGGSPDLPIPVYGVPDGPSNNVVYPAPPPDVPPPISQSSPGIDAPSLQVYGPPQPVYLPGKGDLGSSNSYDLPPLNSNYLPPSSGPSPQYGPPDSFPQLPFSSNPPPFNPSKAHFSSRPVYGPPKQTYRPPRPIYGPPKHQYGPPLKLNSVYGPPNVFSKGPFQSGHKFRGPQGPRGVPAPPTPPDIKYDGWLPMPGISRPPTDTYGIPHHNDAPISVHAQYNNDLVPPPIGNIHLAPPSEPQTGLSDSYGVPLHAVTGTDAGPVHADDHSSAVSLGLTAVGVSGHDQSLSVVKSIGYEIFQNGNGNGYSTAHIGGGGGGGGIGLQDSYGAPPLNSYSPNGPYAAGHSYNNNGLSLQLPPPKSFNNFNRHHHSSGGHHSSGAQSTFGLIPPSGLYGVPPSGKYGTPLLGKPQYQYGPPLNALKINPPKKPVIFREPVPHGLIESIGKVTAQKDALGIKGHSHGNFNLGPKYLPPPVRDLPVKHIRPAAPSNGYALPISGPGQFRNFGNKPSLGFGNSYNIHSSPSLNIETLHVPPLQNEGLTVGLDNSHPPLTIDLTKKLQNSYGTPYVNNFASGPGNLNFAGSANFPVYQNAPGDCNSQKASQPLLSYGVPLANSYTASLSSLTTNIGGGYHGMPAIQNGNDLQTAYSQNIASRISSQSNLMETNEKSTNKESSSNDDVKIGVVDMNNIPLTGALGSYTLQIQSADGNSDVVPHNQVLKNGLLESILAAIEQPDQKDIKILGQTVGKLQPEEVDQQGNNDEVESQKKNVQTEGVKENSLANSTLSLIDNNDIALYFNSNIKKETSPVDEKEAKERQENTIRNGQQYGSYVSFNSDNGRYAYDIQSQGPEGESMTTSEKK